MLRVPANKPLTVYKVVRESEARAASYVHIGQDIYRKVPAIKRLGPMHQQTSTIYVVGKQYAAHQAPHLNGSTGFWAFNRPPVSTKGGVVYEAQVWGRVVKTLAERLRWGGDPYPGGVRAQYMRLVKPYAPKKKG